jgi:hypothetical protein
MNIKKYCKHEDEDFIEVESRMEYGDKDIFISIHAGLRHTAIVLSREDAIKYFETILNELKKEKMGSWKRADKDLDKQELEKVKRLGEIIATHEDTIDKLEIKAKRSKKNFDKLTELYNASLEQNDKLKRANTYLGNQINK